MLPRLLAAAAAVAAALALAGPAAAFTKTDGTATMDDGVALATTLYLPDGTPPAAGWPAVLMLHGLGGSRQDTNLLAETYFAPQGYAVLTYDVRGHGGSDGVVTIAGSREIGDVRALFDQLAARPDVDDARIGAWGISYGGGQTWLAAAAGVPFAAIETVEAWTDLYTALFPQGLSKSGFVAAFLNEIPVGRLAPEYDWVRNDALHNQNLERIRTLAAERSPLAALDRVRVPTLILHPRRDFAFGLDQAIPAFQRLAGPKHLFVGNHGHAPSTFPAADTDYAMTLARRWLDRFLKGEPNGVDTGPAVELSPDPWRGKTVSYAGLPTATTVSFALRGAARTIAADGHAVRDAGRTAEPLETFGSAAVTVSATATASWTRLVAILTARTPEGKQILVSGGGVPTTPGARTYTIRMVGGVTFVPAGSTLRVTLGSSTSGTLGGLLYLDLPLLGSPKLTAGAATLKLPVLAKAVSR